MRRRRAAFAAGTLSLLLAAAPAAGGAPAAVVNGVAIPRDRVEAEVNEYLDNRGTGFQFMTQPSQYKRIRKEVLDKLIDRELLWQEAGKREHIASAEEVDREIARIRESFPTPENFRTRLLIGGFTETTFADHVRRELSIRRLVREEIVGKIAVTDREIEAFYRDNLERMRSPEEVRVRHILIRVDAGGGEEAERKARERIGQVLAEAGAGKDFALLAKTRSEDEVSASRGGDLGFLTRERMVKPFADAAFALAPGETSGAVRTPSGYHLIRLEERRGGDTASLEEAAPRIREQLGSGKVVHAVEEYVRALRAAATVRVLEPR